MAELMYISSATLVERESPFVRRTTASGDTTLTPVTAVPITVPTHTHTGTMENTEYGYKVS